MRRWLATMGCRLLCLAGLGEGWSLQNPCWQVKILAWLVFIHEVTLKPCAWHVSIGASQGAPLWYSRMPAGDVTCELYCIYQLPYVCLKLTLLANNTLHRHFLTQWPLVAKASFPAVFTRNSTSTLVLQAIALLPEKLRTVCLLLLGVFCFHWFFMSNIHPIAKWPRNNCLILLYCHVQYSLQVLFEDFWGFLSAGLVYCWSSHW